jgi:hypothetical protein
MSAGRPTLRERLAAGADIVGGSAILAGHLGLLTEAEAVRHNLYDDPFVSHPDYGRLVEEAADADERRSWADEQDPDFVEGHRFDHFNEAA